MTMPQKEGTLKESKGKYPRMPNNSPTGFPKRGIKLKRKAKKGNQPRTFRTTNGIRYQLD